MAIWHSTAVIRAGVPLGTPGTRVMGVAGTVLVHALLLQSVGFGAQAHRSTPEESGPGASAIRAEGAEYMTVVIVHLPSTRDDTEFADSVASRGADAAEGQVIQIASPDPSPLVLIDETGQRDNGDAEHTAGDPALQSMLFGRYTGQIDARIQRAWTKPRTPVRDVVASNADERTQRSTPVFRCEARIRQDVRGNIQEVELLQCEGSLDWQLSLVKAIQRASPLPAPPSPTVFTSTLVMSFEAAEYIAGQPDEGYEPATVRAAQLKHAAPSITGSMNEMAMPEGTSAEASLTLTD